MRRRIGQGGDIEGRWVGGRVDEWAGRWVQGMAALPVPIYPPTSSLLTYALTHLPINALTHLQLTHLVERLPIPCGFALLEVELGGLLKVTAGTSIISQAGAD